MGVVPCLDNILSPSSTILANGTSKALFSKLQSKSTRAFTLNTASVARPMTAPAQKFALKANASSTRGTLIPGNTRYQQRIPTRAPKQHIQANKESHQINLNIQNINGSQTDTNTQAMQDYLLSPESRTNQRSSNNSLLQGPKGLR